MVRSGGASAAIPFQSLARAQWLEGHLKTGLLGTALRERCYAWLPLSSVDRIRTEVFGVRRVRRQNRGAINRASVHTSAAKTAPLEPGKNPDRGSVRTRRVSGRPRWPPHQPREVLPVREFRPAQASSCVVGKTAEVIHLQVRSVRKALLVGSVALSLRTASKPKAALAWNPLSY